MSQKVCMVNPLWPSDPMLSGFGCSSHHVPLTFLYAMSLMGYGDFENDLEGVLVDAGLYGYTEEETAQQVAQHQPDYIVITTAGTDGDWKTPSSELTVVARLIRTLRQQVQDVPILVCGPHGSTTPDEAFKALDCDGIIRGEAEEVIAELDPAWRSSPYIFVEGKHPWNVDKAVVNLNDLPAIDYSRLPLEDFHHVHQLPGTLLEEPLPLLSAQPVAASLKPGASLGKMSVDVEWSRGCQYACTFCNRADFRNKYRERPLETVLTELMAIKKLDIPYVMFVDDIFGLGRTPELLIEMRRRPVPMFGIQTRVDLWDEKAIDFLAAAGCRHVEFGLESPLPEVLQSLHREYAYTLKRTEEVLLHAVSRIGSVRVSLLEPEGLSESDKARVRDWRESMIVQGCWVSEPRRVFPYPGTLYFKQKVAPVPITANGQWDKANKFYAPETIPAV